MVQVKGRLVNITHKTGQRTLITALLETNYRSSHPLKQFGCWKKYVPITIHEKNIIDNIAEFDDIINVEIRPVKLNNYIFIIDKILT